MVKGKRIDPVRIEGFTGFEVPTGQFTKIPNGFFDILHYIHSASGTKMLAVLIRATFGYQNFGGWIRVSQNDFIHGTPVIAAIGGSPNAFKVARDELIQLGLIECRYDRNDSARRTYWYRVVTIDATGAQAYGKHPLPADIVHVYTGKEIDSDEPIPPKRDTGDSFCTTENDADPRQNLTTPPSKFDYPPPQNLTTLPPFLREDSAPKESVKDKRKRKEIQPPPAATPDNDAKELRDRAFDAVTLAYKRTDAYTITMILKVLGVCPVKPSDKEIRAHALPETEAASPAEIMGFALWYEDRYDDLDLPRKASTLRSHFGAFRENVAESAPYITEAESFLPTLAETARAYREQIKTPPVKAVKSQESPVTAPAELVQADPAALAAVADFIEHFGKSRRPAHSEG